MPNTTKLAFLNRNVKKLIIVVKLSRNILAVCQN